MRGRKTLYGHLNAIELEQEFKKSGRMGIPRQPRLAVRGLFVIFSQTLLRRDLNDIIISAFQENGVG